MVSYTYMTYYHIASDCKFLISLMLVPQYEKSAPQITAPMLWNTGSSLDPRGACRMEYLHPYLYISTCPMLIGSHPAEMTPDNLLERTDSTVPSREWGSDVSLWREYSIQVHRPCRSIKAVSDPQGIGCHHRVVEINIHRRGHGLDITSLCQCCKDDISCTEIESPLQLHACNKAHSIDLNQSRHASRSSGPHLLSGQYKV